ncbi:MAG: sulfatase [Thiotrichales bacterium]|nr:sulfatase [Thiotrichales bacterium]
MNVLLITADQWRGDCLSALGHDFAKTPNLDRLARQGTVFKRHFTTASPCAPGRASLYTGRYMMNHRVVANGVPLSASHQTIATEVGQAGYDALLFGYTDTSADPRGRASDDPALRRLDNGMPGITPVVFMDDLQTPWLKWLREQGYDFPDGELGVFETQPTPGFGRTYTPARYALEHSASGFLTDAVIEQLRNSADTPWFVHLSLWAPHPPFVAAAPFHARVNADDVAPPVRAQTPELEAALHPYLEFWLPNQQGTGIFATHDSTRNLELDDSEVAQARATYFGLMGEVDHHLGRLFSFLEGSGLDQQTLIIFTSDHGEQLGDHWQFAKYGFYDQSFHVPLIIKPPAQLSGCSCGVQIDAFTEGVDVLPTILDCLGLEIPAAVDGRSLRSFLQGVRPERWRTAAHWELDFRNYGQPPDRPPMGLARHECNFSVLRGERYKLVQFAALPPLLFDLETDPGEFVNLAVDPACQTVLLGLTQEMLSWRMRHADQSLTDFELTSSGVVSHAPSRHCFDA